MASRPGQRSLDSMLAASETDRIESLKSYEQVDFCYGAPSTQDHKQLWITRFNFFRQNTLHQDLAKPFTGQDLFRFMSSIINHVIPRGVTAELPNIRTFKNAVVQLTAYGEFQYAVKDGYEMTAQHTARIKALFGAWKQNGNVVTGSSRKRSWVGYCTLSKMVLAFVNSAHRVGTTSWDRVIAKWLSVVLVAATGQRCGDITRSQGYKDEEYIKYKDVIIHLEQADQNNPPRVSDLRARICLAFIKNHKDDENEESWWYGRPLAVDHHMCPIKLLLIHALRHGMLSGTSVEDVLQAASIRADKRIIWARPSLPVLAKFHQHRDEVMLYKEPASPGQLLNSVKEMALLAGIKDRIYTHALRNGHARDIAHLDASKFKGFVSDAIRQALGHQHQNITERYVGGHTSEFWNARAEAKVVHRREPETIVEDAVPEFLAEVRSKVTAEEVDLYRSEHPAEDYKDEAIRLRIREDRLSSLDLPMAPPPKRRKKTVGSESASKLNKPSPPMPAPALSPEEVQKWFNQKQPSFNDTMCTDPELPGFNNSLLVDPELPSLSNGLLIDPELQDLDEDEHEPNVDEMTDRFAHNLELIISTQANDSDTENTELETEMILSLGADDVDGPTVADSHWINAYSRCNVTRNSNFTTLLAKNGVETVSIARNVSRGNSRDEPTPFIFSCDKCSFKTPYNVVIKQYRRQCQTSDSDASQPTNVLKCGYEDCDFGTIAGQQAMKNHVTRIHGWVAKKCPHCDDDSKIYDTRNAYELHIANFHDPRWPTKCLHPDCKDSDEVWIQRTYWAHLTKVHKVTDHRPYTPDGPATVFEKGQCCFVTGCTASKTFQRRSYLENHLVKQHGMTKEDAEQRTASEATFVPRAKRRPDENRRSSVKVLERNHGLKLL